MKYEFKGHSGTWYVDEEKGVGLHILSTNTHDVLASIVCDPLDNEEWANAHLIASAPELLEACIEALKELEYHNWQNTSTANQITQAIHKALNIQS